MLKIALSIAIGVLLINSVAISRDFQDSWILEGLEVTFALFVITYAVTFFSEKKVSKMIALAVIGRFVLLLIPNLKYAWFQGIWIDQHSQYALANHVCNEGFIAPQGPFNFSVYSTTPLIHLTFAIFSIVLNIELVYSIKYLPVLLSPIYPLLTYTIMRKLKVPWGTTALKYALFVSSVPIGAYYVVTGSSFGSLLLFVTLSSLITSIHGNDRRYRFLFIFFVCALAASHSSSSVLLSIFILTIYLLQKASFSRLKPYVKTSAVLTTISVSGAWLMFSARHTLEKIVGTFFSGVGGQPTPGAEQVPSRFFELARVNMLEAIKSALPFYGGDIFVLLMSFAGLLILLKMWTQLDGASKFLTVLFGAVFSTIPIGLLLRVGGFRTLGFARLLFPIFSAIFILHLGKRKAWMRAIILLPMILLATFQFYICQPLIPSANVLFADLPTNEPIVYVNLVNSVYQRQMINFAKDHATGHFALDSVTKDQMLGLTDLDFVLEHIGWVHYYPLGKGDLERKYDCFLIHLPGISGGFGEKAEMRTRHVILEAIYDSSIVYTNGESYILANNFS